MPYDAGLASIANTLTNTLGAAANQPRVAVTGDGSGLDIDYSRVNYNNPIASIDPGGGGMTLDYRPGMDLGELRQGMQQNQADQAQAENPPIGKISQTPEGRWQLDVSDELLRKTLKNFETVQGLQRGMSGEIERLRRQEEYQRAHPIANILTTVAGNLAANDPKMPGFVRGLGAASLALNPSASQLQQQRMGLEDTLMRAAQASSSEAFGMARMLQADRKEQRLEDTAAAKEKAEQERLGLTAQRDLQRYHATILTNHRMEALKGALPKGSGAAIAEELKAADMPVDLADKTGRLLEDMSARVQAAERAKEAAKDERERKQIASREKMEADRASALIYKVYMGQKDQTAEAQKKEDIKMGTKEFETERTQIAAADKLSNKAQELERLLKVASTGGAIIDPTTGKPVKFDPAVGVVGGRKPVVMLGHLDANIRAKFITLMADLNDAVLKAKARFWTPVEQQNLADKLPSKEKPIDFNIGTLQEIKDAAMAVKRESIQSTPHVNWFDAKTSSVLGKDRESLLTEHASALGAIDSSLVPPEWRQKADEATVKPPDDPEFKALLKTLKPGRFIKDEQGRLWMNEDGKAVPAR